MAVDIAAIVGAENMHAEKKEDVILILRLLPTPAAGKRYTFARWSRLVNIQPLPADIDRVAPWGGV